MRSEENTETSLEALPEEQLPVEVRHHPLPWVLFGVSLLLLAVVGVLLARRASTEIQRAEHEKFLREEADQGRAAATAERAGLTARIGELEQKLSSNDEATRVLEARVKTAEAARELAEKKLKRPPESAPAAAKKATPTKAAAKKKKKR